ncbi:MAG TPA: hypothetical protein VG756_00170 [Pseudonocardiaceae bacterium]|nr:hypothetical protein [Pseudonocardiaceae bacterium]
MSPTLSPVVRRAGLAAALAVGSVLIALPATASAATTTTTPTPQQDLDRCWAAIQATGYTAVYPDISTWVAQFQSADTTPDAQGTGRMVTAARADGKPVFCETTPTSVSVSDPNLPSTLPDGTLAIALLGSDDGVLAGVTSTTTGLSAAITTGAATVDATAFSGNGLGDGMFVAHGYPHGFEHSTVAVSSFGQLDGGQPVQTPAPLVFLVDRPQPADRRSPAGRALQSCLDTVTAQVGPVLDQASWRPGAVVDNGTGTHLVITTNASEVSVCLTKPDYADGFWFAGSSAPENTAVPLDVVYRDSQAGPAVIAGLAAPNVGRVEFSTPAGTTEASLVGSTFGASVPDLAEATVTVFDRCGNQIYSGPQSGLPSRPRG